MKKVSNDVKFIVEHYLKDIPNVEKETIDVFENVMDNYFKARTLENSMPYVATRILHYIDFDPDDIVEEMYVHFKTNNLFETIEEDTTQKMITDVVAGCVKAYKPLNDTEYKRFYKHILTKMLTQQPMFFVTFDKDENWIPLKEEKNTYQHKEAPNIFKIMFEEQANIIQSDYYIMIDSEGNSNLDPMASILDISDMAAWDSSVHVPITMEKFEHFKMWFAEQDSKKS